MDTEHVESLLAAEALARQRSAPAGPPGQDCLTMPILADIASHRLLPTLGQVEHIRSCPFCTGIIFRLRFETTIRHPKDREAPPGPANIRTWIRWCLWPVSMAACLAIGFALGTFQPGSRPARTGTTRDVLDRAADVLNRYHDLQRGMPDAGPPAARSDTVELAQEGDKLAKALRELIDYLNDEYSRSLDSDANTESRTRWAPD